MAVSERDIVREDLDYVVEVLDQAIKSALHSDAVSAEFCWDVTTARDLLVKVGDRASDKPCDATKSPVICTGIKFDENAFATPIGFKCLREGSVSRPMLHFEADVPYRTFDEAERIKNAFGAVCEFGDQVVVTTHEEWDRLNQEAFPKDTTELCEYTSDPEYDYYGDTLHRLNLSIKELTYLQDTLIEHNSFQGANMRDAIKLLLDARFGVVMEGRNVRS